MIYLTAQRVLSPQGVQGINAFRYQKDRTAVPLASLLGDLDTQPGTLVSQSVLVPPPGNRVRSYIDIVVPDTLSPEQLTTLVEHFITSVAPEQPMPWAHESGQHAIRFLCERSIALVWDQEARALAQTASLLLR